MSTVIETAQNSLFVSVVPVAACQRCFDTGIWLTPRNVVDVCPRIQLRERHAEKNDAAKLLCRSAYRQQERKMYINSMTFDFARILTNYTTDKPCPRAELEELFFGDTNLSAAHIERRVKSIIEDLRKLWLLPVGSRKFDPAGYWIITELDDFKEWITRVKAAPITQLSTIHKVARHNFPVFAEQMELEFWADIKTDDEE